MICELTDYTMNYRSEMFLHFRAFLLSTRQMMVESVDIRGALQSLSGTSFFYEFLEAKDEGKALYAPGFMAGRKR
jgi:hypothetical protein